MAAASNGRRTQSSARLATSSSGDQSSRIKPEVLCVLVASNRCPIS